MQNKGLIRFLAWTFAVVCLIQLSFTVATKAVEGKASRSAKNYAESESVKNFVASRTNDPQTAEMVKDSLRNAYEANYLDSIASSGKGILLGVDYRGCQNREIGLGLDLKGGMNVMLEVSTVDVVRALANHTQDTLFNHAIDLALKNQKTATNRDFVSLFYDAILSLDPSVQLAPYFNSQLREEIKLGDNNDAVIKVVRASAADAYQRTYQVLSQRIDKFGVAQPSIQMLPASERILVELPGVKEPERVRKLLQGTAQLEFWLTYRGEDTYSGFIAADEYLASLNKDASAAASNADAADTIAKDADTSLLDRLTVAGENDEISSSVDEAAHPLLSKMQIFGGREGAVVAMARGKDREAISQMLDRAFEKRIFDSRTVKFLWGAKPNEGTDVYSLYAIKITTRDGSPLLDGGCISDARQDFDSRGNIEVSMTMNSEGAREWQRITADNIGNCIAIALDDLVYTAPNVNTEIAGGRSSITGGFDVNEAKDLATILKSGKLPAPAVIVQEAVVGPSLGQESVHNGLLSFILAFIVVLLYMVFFYNRAGMVSVVALLVNVFLLLGMLASIGTVLTLPGIAGIVLTMAMAVDGNVIIYERVKEELRAGSSLANAVSAGFKNALSAIIDGQVTTFLLGLVLIMFGSGAVQGFAVTLCVGIVTSLFTSIFITRLLIDSRVEKKKTVTFSNSLTENFLRNTKIDFIGNRKKFYLVAIIAIVICAGSLVLRGLSFGIDFTGGRTYVVRFDQNVDINKVRTDLVKQFDNSVPEVKSYGSARNVKITTSYKSDVDGSEVQDEIVSKLYAGTSSFFASPISIDDFKSTENNPYGIIQAEQFGAGVAHDNLVHSIWAVLGGLVVMFIYIGLRFRNWRYGIGSVVALTHDTILIIGVFSLFHGLLNFNLDVDQYFITAVLTIIGYSINATVVIFDRIREFRKLYPKRDLRTQMNDAINSTLARTVNTSGSTFFTLLMMWIFGGVVIKGFITALLVGVLVGVFSSVCLASAIVYWCSKKERKAEEVVVK